MTHEDYLRAMNFWESKPGRKEAPREVIEAVFREYAKSEKACVLATGNGDYVRATPVHYVFHNGFFYIHTEGGMKFKSLEHNKNVSLAIYDTKGDLGHLKSVQIMGKAEFIDIDTDEYAEICKVRNISVDTIKKLPYPMYLIKVIPTEVIMLDSDFKNQGYDIRQKIQY